jgi:hypothetical protein
MRQYVPQRGAMSYHGIGAGPGPVATYKVDAPFPWGDNTSVSIPVQAMVTDAWNAVSPKIDALEAKLVSDMEDEATLFAPKLAKQVMDEVISPEINNQMEVAFAQLDLIEQDAVKAFVIVGATIVLATGLAAWWIKKG